MGMCKYNLSGEQALCQAVATLLFAQDFVRRHHCPVPPVTVCTAGRPASQCMLPFIPRSACSLMLTNSLSCIVLRPTGWLYTWQVQAEGSHLLQLMRQMDTDRTEMDFLDGQIKKTSAHGVAPVSVLHSQ